MECEKYFASTNRHKGTHWNFLLDSAMQKCCMFRATVWHSEVSLPQPVVCLSLGLRNGIPQIDKGNEKFVSAWIEDIEENNVSIHRCDTVCGQSNEMRKNGMVAKVRRHSRA